MRAEVDGAGRLRIPRDGARHRADRRVHQIVCEVFEMYAEAFRVRNTEYIADVTPLVGLTPWKRRAILQ